MKQTKGFIVNSNELFKSGKLTVKDARDNPKIEKRCPICNSILTLCTTFENGIEDTSLYCLKCKV
jgi:hypothetical protein